MINGYKKYGKDFLSTVIVVENYSCFIELEKDNIVNLYNSKYFHSTYVQFTEYLAEREDIFLSVPVAGQILRDRGFLSPRFRRKIKKI